MLERRVAGNGVVWYESPLLRSVGVPHAFSTRRGGVSAGVFASLNLGNPSGCADQDTKQNLERNYGLVLSAAGFGDRQLCRVHQVHGNEVFVAGRGMAHDPDARADSVVTDDSSRVVSVRVADCVPVLIASVDGAVVAAVHAGWKGVATEATRGAVTAMRRFAPTAELVAAIGPGIGMEAFEVGPEVVHAMEAAFTGGLGDCVRNGRGDRQHLDLKRLLARQLRELGIERVDHTDRCTVADPGDFFSHRRDNGVTGRMAAFVGPK